MDDFKSAAPAEWQAHWAAMPNSVRALYGIFALRGTGGFIKREIRIEAWGQLCFDEAARNAIAYHIHNHPVMGWRPIGWRCEMDGEPVGGGKLSGDIPDDFDVFDYVPRR